MKTMNKTPAILFLLSLAVSTVIAAEHQRGPRPQLTDAQKTCLEGKLGARDSGNRPSKEAFEAAMNACGVEKPKGPPPGERPVQDDQQNQDSNQSADE